MILFKYDLYRQVTPLLQEAVIFVIFTLINIAEKGSKHEPVPIIKACYFKGNFLIIINTLFSSLINGGLRT